MTLTQKLASKQWNIRADAYEELVSQLSTQPELYRQKLDKLPNYISDANPGAQEKAFQLAKMYFEHQKELLNSIQDKVFQAVIEKGLTSNK